MWTRRETKGDTAEMCPPEPYYRLTPVSDVTYLKGVGPRRAAVLKKHGIITVRDLLYHIPRKYLDRTTVKSIRSLRVGDEAVIIGRIMSFGIQRTRKRNFFQLTVTDDTGILNCVWFHSLSWVSEKFSEGDSVAFFGKVEFYNGLKLVHPDFDLLDTGEDPVNTGKILAMYPSTAELKGVGLDSRGFRRIIRNALDHPECIPPDTLKNTAIPNPPVISLPRAIRSIHQPDSMDDMQTALYRLKFEEHFYFQLLMALRRRVVREMTGRIFDSKGPYVKAIYQHLPFQLTDAQIRVLREIRKDLRSPYQMNRLLQGDVGSGKTVVAMLAAALVIGNGAQVAVMAPTEILAEQHYHSFRTYCNMVDINIALLKGGMKGAERKDLLSRISDGEIQLVVGTHALIQEDVKFKDLGLIIMDEQHRFGVDQRKTLFDKGYFPEVLAMTATPIPRTLAITYHGDMDVSVIDELPKNRKPIITKVVTPGRLKKVWNFMKREMAEGRQCFVVYPLIEESEKMDLEASETGYIHLKEEIFPDFSVGYVNGRMPSEERDAVMTRFKNKELDLLVATTVVEVGIDIPNASVMVIENAERFGLAQLHQLRGRIGRGEHKSYCILVRRKKTETGELRLKIMERTSNGFDIADEDLKIRGPGEFFGTRQSGYARSKLIDFQEDGPIIRFARQLAFEIVDKDPHLTARNHTDLRKKFMENYRTMLDFVRIG